VAAPGQGPASGDGLVSSTYELRMILPPDAGTRVKSFPLVSLLSRSRNATSSLLASEMRGLQMAPTSLLLRLWPRLHQDADAGALQPSLCYNDRRGRRIVQEEIKVRPLRIQGMVRMADMVRRELAQPISAAQKERLTRMVADSLLQVDGILANHQSTIRALPSPTRRAYEFLSGLDFRIVESTVPEAEEVRPRESVSFAGLASHWERLLNTMAQSDARSKADRLHASIASSSRDIEQHIETCELQIHELTPRTRLIRGWLAFFSQRENFDAYLVAVACARPAFEASFQTSGRFKPPAVIHFRPTHSIYQARGYRDGTRIVLPTPMISFPAELIETVAGMAFNGARARQQVMEATLSDDYQEIQAELDALGGVEEQATGAFRDLGASFTRVNQAYFQNSLAQPRLTWSKVFTGRKFGHYDRIRDVVMISSTLDRAEVPEYVLDSVMYHELLHKKLGAGWCNGRMLAHTPEFRSLDRDFQRYNGADSFLKRLAGWGRFAGK